MNDINHEPPKAGFRQTMAWLHTWAGLTLGWLLLFVFVTGTAGYFDTEIDRWMQPELPPAPDHIETECTANQLLNYLRHEAPGADRWLLKFPTGRNQPYASVYWQGASTEAGARNGYGEQRIDLVSGEPLEARETGGGQLLYQMHWRLHYLTRTYSDWIISIATFFMLVAIVSGVIIHKKIFKDFFTFRPKKRQRSWLDAHSVLSVVALPFHLMITYSGLVFMGFSYMPLIVAAHYGVDGEGRSEFYSEVFSPPGLTEAAGERAPLIPLTEPMAEAEKRWGEGQLQSVNILHPGDRNARIVLSKRSDSDLTSGADRLVFDGTSGELLHVAPSANSEAKGVRDWFLGLHEGLFAPPFLRWLYFFSGVLGSGMVATGLVLWAVKRRQKAERQTGHAPPGLRLVEKLNVGTVVGMPVGIAAYFWANRLLPVDWSGRGDWEAHTLFLTWLALLLHAAVRPTGRAWVEQLLLAAFAYAALPLLNALTTDRDLVNSLAATDWVFVGVDLTLFVIGVCFGVAARVMAKNRRVAEAGTISELNSEEIDMRPSL